MGRRDRTTGRESRRARLRVARSGAPGTRPVRRTSINWDRLGGRWLLAVVGLMLVLYIAPVQNYFKQRSEMSAKHSELRALTAENKRLKDRARALTRDSVIELEARRLGMVKADERSFVVK
jgi:hypothetical protein